MQLAIDSRKLLHDYKPAPYERTHALIVTFYLTADNDNPFDYSYVAPVSWSNRVRAKDIFERILRKYGHDVIGSVLIGLEGNLVPDNDNDAIRLIEQKVPGDTPTLLLQNLMLRRGVH